MAVPSISRLRPNTYLVLLIRAARSEFGNSPSWGRSSNGLTRSALLADLMTILGAETLTTQNTLSSYMSSFLNGSRSYSKTYFPFNTIMFRSKAQLRMEDDYTNTLYAMDTLCRTYLNIDSQPNLRLLVGGLIEVITQDDSIDGTFCIGDHRIEKSKLCEVTDVSLQPFLLDVWYQLATQYHNSEEAKVTYKEWTGEGSPRPITTCIGMETAKKITVSTTLPEKVAVDTVTNCNRELDQDESAIDAIVIDENTEKCNDNQQSTGTTQNQTLIINESQFNQTDKAINTADMWRRDFYALQKQDILDMSAMPWMDKTHISYHLVIPAMLVSNTLLLSKNAKESISQINFINNYILVKNLAIIGNAGSGKSTLMYCLYLSQIERDTNDFNIFADPRWFMDYAGGSLVDYLLQRAGFSDWPKSNYQLIRVYIDGFDEVESATQQKIMHTIDEHRTKFEFIISCREHEFRETIIADNRWYRLFHEIVEISNWSVDFSNEYVLKFLNRIGLKSERASGFIQKFSANRDFAEIYANPFQLNILLYLSFMNDTDGSELDNANLFALYDNFVRAVYKNELKRKTTSCSYVDFIESTTTIAKKIFHETDDQQSHMIKQIGYRFKSIFSGELGKKIKANSIFASLLHLDQDGDVVRFRHETIYEYFLAKSFLLSLQEGTLEGIIKEFGNFYGFYINKFIRAGISAYEANSQVYYNALGSIYRECIKQYDHLDDLYINSVFDYSAICANRNYTTDTLPQNATTIRELCVYYTGRLRMNRTPELLHFALRYDPEPVIHRTAILGLMLHNNEKDEMEYLNGLIPGSNSDLMQRSLSLLYFGDDKGDIYTYRDAGIVPWNNSKKEILERLKVDSDRNYLFRMWDLRTLYLFCESRHSYRSITDDEYRIIAASSVISPLYSDGKKIRIAAEKERLLKKIKEESL